MRHKHGKAVSFGTNEGDEEGTEMIFREMDQAEENHKARTKSFGGSRRKTTTGLRPVSVSKMELAEKLTRHTMGKQMPRPSGKTNHEESFDRLLRE